jgi:lysine 6-dehydrogenase
MKILVIGAGMMGWAAAFDMARSSRVEAVTLADSNLQRLDDAVTRINKLTGNRKVTPMQVDAADTPAVLQLMRGHDGVLSAVPYFFNLELAKAAIEAGCHFADLGGNNTVVKQEFALHDQAQAAGVAIAPDCGLSPGMASILGGELLRCIGGQADALKIYVSTPRGVHLLCPKRSRARLASASRRHCAIRDTFACCVRSTIWACSPA